MCVKSYDFLQTPKEQTKIAIANGIFEILSLEGLALARVQQAHAPTRFWITRLKKFLVS